VPASAPAFLLPGFVHSEVTPRELGAVQGIDRGLRLLLARHFDEAETLGTPRFALGDHLRRYDRSMSRKRPL